MASKFPPKGMVRINLNIKEEEREHLLKYCEKKKRSMTEVLREIIRNLKV